MNRKKKIILSLIISIVVIYTALWFKITMGIASKVNELFADKIQTIDSNHRIKFSKVSITGFPFAIAFKVYDLIEDTTMAVIEHREPVLVGYNILSQELAISYYGKSSIKYKPIESKFGINLDGHYKTLAVIPLSGRIIKSLWDKEYNILMLGSIKRLQWNVSDLKAYDIVDNAKIMETKNIGIVVNIGNNKTYQKLDEILNDIPQDYTIDLDLDTTYIGANPKPIPYSLIYGLLLSTDLKYTMQASIHTDSSKLNLRDILSQLHVDVTRSEMRSDIEDTSSKLDFVSDIKENKMRCALDYTSDAKIKSGYTKQLDKALKSLSNIPPSISSMNAIRMIVQSLDISSVDFDTKGEAVSIACKAEVTEEDKKLKLNLSRFGMHLRDIGIDIQNKTETDMKFQEWLSKGVVSISQYTTLVQYITELYFKVTSMPNSVPFDNNFYSNVAVDFLKKIADGVNDEYANMTINYSLDRDIPQSKIGKFTLPEATLLYYATLLKHTNSILQDTDKAMEQFKRMVPNYVLEDESLSKILKQSKE